MAVSSPGASRFDARVAAVMPGLAARVAALDERVRAAGLRREELVDVAALDRLAVVTKDELLELQQRDPPFGGMLAPGSRPRRVFQSPGPLYEPEPRASDPWRWAPALQAAGFGPGDVVLVAFSYHLSPAGAMFEEAADAIGCTVLPGGVGSMDLQAQAVADLGAGAFIGLPSYLKALLELLDGRGRLDKAFVTAEPLPSGLRAWLRERVAVVRQGYGTAETGNLGYECEAEDGWHVPDDALVEVCDLETGRPLPPGEEGQVVVTLFREDYAVVRLGTGDLSAFVGAACSCGRTSPRLAGWLGRTGDAVKVRGMFLHPRQIRAAMGGLEGVQAYRFVVDRVAHRDELRVEVRPAAGADPVAVAERVRERVRSSLRFGAQVAVVEGLDAQAAPLVDARDWSG